jgi:hypothetical protein
MSVQKLQMALHATAKWPQSGWRASAMMARWVYAVFAALVVSAGSLSAKELETTHLFGFTLGSDTNDVGEREAESETTGRFGKSAGSYTALSSSLGVKFVPVENFTVEPGISFSRYDVSGVSGLDDRHQTAFESLSFETRYRVLDRTKAPFGLTFGIDPRWGRVDDVSGEPVNSYSTDLLVIADRELIPDRLFAAFNLIYSPEATQSRVSGAWEHQSDLALTAATASQIYPGIVIGVETRYLRSYGGMGLDRLTDQALYVGPTFYAKINELYWVSAAWNAQVASRASLDVGGLAPQHFERNQVKFRLGRNF